ncbi:MAG: acetoacetate--CoA ligase [Syntrophomonadaceae bacterium]|nr:acetoacetate--CoA ligase [Syntrophomonadaceae bacterium]
MKVLWQPSPEQIKKTNMTSFINMVNKKYGITIDSYAELYEWSIQDIADFWAAMWQFGRIISSQVHNNVLHEGEDMLAARWFAGAQLNFAQNLLRYRDDHIALVAADERGKSREITYAELYDQVAGMAQALRQAGIKAGDRVAGYLPNIPESIIAMLAASSIGAIWSSCSPDFGFKGVVDRFGQIAPRILFCCNGYYYNGKYYDSMDKVAQIAAEISSIERIIVVPFADEGSMDFSKIEKAVLYPEFIDGEAREIIFEQLPFDHPLYIMYSSGTTGAPKCMVHGQGGTLIQHLKELMLHTDLTRDDTIFYFTTCGWMMWNWLVSSLAVGATLLLYDGSPFYPDAAALMRLSEKEKISVFGTSAKYLISIEKEGLKPGKDFDLSSLRTILSTGSPLPAESFEYVYREIKPDLILSSISGGTDIISCFALGNPIGPVIAGELQCRGLGLKVQAYNEMGQAVIAEKGELVCTRPFPSMPVYYWNDPDGEKYRSAYFKLYPGIWSHGDYIEISPEGGVIIYGRSDATLNPGGVRIGTAEIYRQVDGFPEIADSVAVGQSWNNDIRVILFVKMNPEYTLNDDLIGKLKDTIRRNTSSRHVPEKIIAVPDVPYTLNGKKIEVAIKKILDGLPVTNRDALANPEALEYYRDLPELMD